MKSIQTILAVLALTVSGAAFANSATTGKTAVPVENAVSNEGTSLQAEASAKQYNKRDKHAKRVAHKSYKTK